MNLLKFIPQSLQGYIAQHSQFSKILENIGWLFFDKILRMGLGLFIGVWIARYLGPEQFGLLSFAVAFTWLFGAVSTLGLPEIVVRDLVRKPDTKLETLGTAAALLLLGGVLTYCLILITIFWIRPEDLLAKVLVAILGSVVLFKASEIAIYWFESQVLSKYSVWAQNSSFIIFTTIKALLIIRSAPLTAFAWATLGEALMTTLLLSIVLGKHGPQLVQLRVKLARAKELLSDGWPLLLSGMVLMLQARVDQIMLGQMIGDNEVAQYSVALRIIETAAFVGVVLKSTFGPAIITAKENSKDDYLKKLISFYKLNFLVSILITLPVAIFSIQIIDVLFGDEYSRAAPILSLMSLRIIFSHFGIARSIYLLNENLLNYSAMTMFIGTITNIILNYYMIPIYGGIGATFASLISFFMTIFFIDFFYVRTRENARLMIFSILNYNSFFKNKNLS